MIVTSGRRFTYDLETAEALFSSDDPDLWERAYEEIMDPKYKKSTRGWSRTIKAPVKEPLIYLIPRQRGPSYKDNTLVDHHDLPVGNNEIQYCPISKGYPMQDVSSFTLGPIVGSGLCLVNSAFSKGICVHHLEGGRFDPSRKNYWNSPKNRKVRHVELLNKTEMLVDGLIVDRVGWLKDHQVVTIRSVVFAR